MMSNPRFLPKRFPAGALLGALLLIGASLPARGQSQAPAASSAPAKNALAPPDAAPSIAPAASSPAGDSITMRQLNNGLTFIHKRNRSNRIVGLSCVIMAGSAYEIAEENGVTNLCLSVMRKGTQSLTAQEIDERLEALGASLSDTAGEDFSSWSLISTLDDWEASLDLLTDILLHPSFPPDEIENERKQVLAGIRMEEDNSFAYTYKQLKKLLYEGHPYAQPVEGTPETVAALTGKQLAALHATQMTPANMIISIVGDLDEAQALEAIRKRLGGPCSLARPRVEPGKEFVPQFRTREFKKKKEQAFLCLGHTTTSIHSPDYPALRIVSTVLGEGMSGRLFAELREKQGLAYAVGSAHRARKKQSHLLAYIGTKPETLDQARQGLMEQIERLKKEPVPEDELTRAKNYTVGRYLMGHQTNSDQAYFLAYWQAMGMGADFDKVYPQLLEKVTARDLMKVANKYFHEPTITILRPESAEGPGAPQTNPQ